MYLLVFNFINLEGDVKRSLMFKIQLISNTVYSIEVLIIIVLIVCFILKDLIRIFYVDLEIVELLSGF